MWTRIELQTQQFCAQALKKIIYKSGPPVSRNYPLFTNFISMEAIVHKTLILYEIAVGNDKGLNLEVIFKVYTFFYTPCMLDDVTSCCGYPGSFVIPCSDYNMETVLGHKRRRRVRSNKTWLLVQHYTYSNFPKTTALLEGTNHKILKHLNIVNSTWQIEQ